MKTLQSNITEALFSKEQRSGKKIIDRMYTLPQPKDEIDYLNYLCAWYRILAMMFYNPGTCYWLIGQHANKETYVEYCNALIDLYILNLPNYHIETTQDDFEAISYDAYNVEALTMTGYEDYWDENLVKPGKLDIEPLRKCMEEWTKVTLDGKSNGNQDVDVMNAIIAPGSRFDKKTHFYYFLINGRANNIPRGRLYFHSSKRPNPAIKYKNSMQKWIDEIVSRFKQIVGRDDIVFKLKN